LQILRVWRPGGACSHSLVQSFPLGPGRVYERSQVDVLNVRQPLRESRDRPGVIGATGTTGEQLLDEPHRRRSERQLVFAKGRVA
jgi:hypothetical protein